VAAGEEDQITDRAPQNGEPGAGVRTGRGGQSSAAVRRACVTPSSASIAPRATGKAHPEVSQKGATGALTATALGGWGAGGTVVVREQGGMKFDLPVSRSCVGLIRAAAGGDII
jgi:hypothetical protein